ncbi:MAG: mandelate racemase/muconate lactonizing enzyme family protein [Bryobacterales bacterium]|nr:mandelate racemase/muconate lactonizing enzyme family protein [Bryobacterales bacterium]
MRFTRRQAMVAGAGIAASVAWRTPGRSDPALGERLAKAMNAPVLRRELLRAPVKVESVELLKSGGHFLVRAQGEGLSGYSEAHSAVMNAAWPILVKKVAPHFVGKDARDLEASFQAAYLAGSNYKWQGLPFWVSMAAVEIAILDLLGKAAKKPLGELLGNVTQRKIAVYRASGNRGNSPEAEIDYLRKIVGETGAKAIKFRLGARMRYDDASTKRDLALIPLTRKTFGDSMTIYADANGSYDVPMAIRIGKVMEAHGLRFFEEPAPFDYYDETKAIGDSLKIPIALGEQEASLRGFRRIIEHGIAKIVQPDLMYFGGLIRSMKVARMAQAAGLECTPHMSGGGLGYLYVAHFASCVPNAGPHQEYKGEDDTLPVTSGTSTLTSEDGQLTVPTGPGLGVDFEGEFLKRATVIKA